jgi:hypothetical protein
MMKREWRTTIRGTPSVILLSLCLARSVRAQDEIIRTLGLDRLQITSLGAAYGLIAPSQVKSTHLYAVQADYGNISPTWRVVVGASFWSSRFDDDVVQTFVDSLHKSLTNASAHVVASQVRVYDVAFSGDVRFTPDYSGDIKPFIGVGLAAHVINAEGPLIDGTFVERALDDIAAGFYVTGGAAVRLVPHFGIEAAARADLLSGFRSIQVRAGAAYYFGHIRGRTTPSGDGPASSSSNGKSTR